MSRKDFDVVASWSVDRLGRSLVDLVSLLQELHFTGVDLYLHQQGINTTTPAGKALFGMVGVFAEFERGTIQKRVRSGVARAKTKGTKSGNAIGRPAVHSGVEAQIRMLRPQGLGIIKIAKQVGCGVSVMQRVLAALTFQHPLFTAVNEVSTKGIDEKCDLTRNATVPLELTPL